jgi:hypothetical protein
MPQLMFRCPYTNKPIQPGIELAAESFRAVAEYPISMFCPHCGEQHHGSMGDGCLTEQLAPMLVPQNPE